MSKAVAGQEGSTRPASQAAHAHDSAWNESLCARVCMRVRPCTCVDQFMCAHDPHALASAKQERLAAVRAAPECDQAPPTSALQVRLHAPARTHGTWSARNGAYVVEPAQLPFFVDSDWSLDFGVPAVPIYDAQGASDVTLCCWPPYACIELGGEDGRGRQGSWGSQASHVPAHTLHMVLYVPPASRRPMLLLQRAGGGAALTSSFWVPHWGGVHLLQREGEAGGAGEELPGAGGVDKGDGDGQGAAQQRPPGAMGRGLDARAMHDFAESTTAQLRVLFGLGAGPEEALQVPSGGGTGSGHSSRGSRVAGLPAVRVLPASVAGFAQWEVDLVLVSGAAVESVCILPCECVCVVSEGVLECETPLQKHTLAVHLWREKGLCTHECVCMSAGAIKCPSPAMPCLPSIHHQWITALKKAACEIRPAGPSALLCPCGPDTYVMLLHLGCALGPPLLLRHLLL